MLDLEPGHLQIIKNILATYAKDKIVWAYGSRVKGTAHAGSDLDLMIIDPKGDFKSEALTTLKTAFSESHLPILVDVFNWADIPDSFNRQDIEKVHEVIQA